MVRKQMMLVLSGLIIVMLAGVVLIAFNRHAPKTTSTQSVIARDSNKIYYVPLGDSYTIGQSIAESGRWPNQLVATYKPGDKQLVLLANPAVTGYTTQDLINTELPLMPKLKPDFVTVQIGVNDYVQGMSIQTFQKNLQYIVAQLQAEMAQPQNILLVTIPDYAKTPTGAQYGDPAAATAAIQQFNQVIINQAMAAQLPYADIFGVSQKVAQDPGLIANDGLHPSAEEYAMWIQIITQSLQAASIPATN